ncbi:Rv2231c family pyridoxal phosphate-dependent protein CobC [Streptomyces fuscigenes]|uniref:Rv2231c family pyridoxal phosphate-dependent protein CobC n=1 Tax=Streptomyces fuscigenes TaxID=1528880 RepID=UPI001F28B43A|nr:Rv2231c family pyridoxal phosphate-dependent protein CobC [Streptomyces fuscigenes]MCF3965142.1 Rv2231c family pyridoxal phosphate-dependent protein CobC [Streptomyces fuscigenes]
MTKFTFDAPFSAPDLIVGIGARPGVAADDVIALVADALLEARLRPAAVAELATLDTRAAEPGLLAAAARLGVPLTGHPAGVLDAVAVPRPADGVRAAVGTGSVAEAAALARGGHLVVAKRKAPSATATCAIARKGPPRTAPGDGGAPDAVGDGSCAPRGQNVCTEGRQLGHAEPDADAPSPRGAYGGSAVRRTAEQATADPHTHDLRHHGDDEVRDRPGDLVDLAVNVRGGTPPAWLRERIAESLTGLAAYPDGRRARAAVAARHGLPVERVLLTAGAAEAFVLLARALRVRRPVVVHPQFTEPEAALRDAGHEVRRVLLRREDGFRLDPDAVPEDADLVVVGNPTNPTSVLHPADTLASLARPGRVLVVDEAFMDAVPGELESLAGDTDVPGLVVLRSLTKTWGLAGLRIGYVLGDPPLISELQRAQPLWPVSTPALAAAEACMTPAALHEADAAARRMCAERAHLLAGLAEFEEVEAVHAAEGPFVLVRTARAQAVRARLRTYGFAVRRGDTFPGLDGEWLRLAVRDRMTTNRFLQALDLALTGTARAA